MEGWVGWRAAKSARREEVRVERVGPVHGYYWLRVFDLEMGE